MTHEEICKQEAFGRAVIMCEFITKREKINNDEMKVLQDIEFMEFENSFEDYLYAGIDPSDPESVNKLEAHRRKMYECDNDYYDDDGDSYAPPYDESEEYECDEVTGEPLFPSLKEIIARYEAKNK